MRGANWRSPCREHDMKWETLWNTTTERARIKHGRSLNCAFEYTMRTQEGPVISELWSTWSCKVFLWNGDKEEKKQSCVCFLALALKPMWTPSFPTWCQYNILMTPGFSFFCSFMILYFTSTSKYTKLRRFFQEFRSYFFHILFFKITITSEIHSIMHKNRWYSYYFATKNH